MDPLPLDEQQFVELASLRVLGEVSLRQLISNLAKLPQSPMHLSKLHRIIEASLPGNEMAANAIIQQVISTFGWVRQGGLRLADVLAGTSSAVSNSSGWSAAELEEWSSIEPVFHELVQLPVIRLSAAANELSFENSNLLQRVRILTEVRPIFDEGATVIEGAVISHSLRLLFHSIDGPHELTIALDETDVDNIAEQCARAREKARIAHELMLTKAGVPSIVSGATDDG